MRVNGAAGQPDEIQGAETRDGNTHGDEREMITVKKATTAV